jgi:cytochrome bd-type quinol oxidase subunit 2
MKCHIAEWLNRKITNEDSDIRVAQSVCFVAAVLVLALSQWKLARLDLTESQLFFGVLLSLAAPLLFVVIGLLLPIQRRIQKP